MTFLDVFLTVIFECNHSKTVWGVFHDLKNVKIAEESLKIGKLLSILAHFSHILATFYEFKSRFKKSW
jgi:hypothetical protein